jgi:hypothetical protein
MRALRGRAGRLALSVSGVLAASACGEAFGVQDVLGVWNTQSINSYPVPGTVLYEGVPHDTDYVRWTFYDGGRCTLTQEVDGQVGTFDECEYTVDPEQETVTIVLFFEQWAGSLDGDRMTLTDPQDVVWELRAQ